MDKTSAGTTKDDAGGTPEHKRSGQCFTKIHGRADGHGVDKWHYHRPGKGGKTDSRDVDLPPQIHPLNAIA